MERLRRGGYGGVVGSFFIALRSAAEMHAAAERGLSKAEQQQQEPHLLSGRLMPRSEDVELLCHDGALLIVSPQLNLCAFY